MSLVNYFQLTQCQVWLNEDYLELVKAIGIDIKDIGSLHGTPAYGIKVKSFVAVHGNNLVQLYFHNGEMIVLPTGAIFAVTKR